MLSMRCTRLPPMSVIVPLGTSPLASGTGVGERCLGSNPEICTDPAAKSGVGATLPISGEAIRRVLPLFQSLPWSRSERVAK